MMTNRTRPMITAFAIALGFLGSGESRAFDEPLTEQLVSLGRQAAQAGQARDASRFFRKALERDPGSLAARQGLESLKLAVQEPAAPAPTATF